MLTNLMAIDKANNSHRKHNGTNNAIHNNGNLVNILVDGNHCNTKHRVYAAYRVANKIVHAKANDSNVSSNYRIILKIFLLIWVAVL